MSKCFSRKVWVRAAILFLMIAILLSYEGIFSSHLSKWGSSIINIALIALALALGRLFPAGEYSKIQRLHLSAQPPPSHKNL